MKAIITLLELIEKLPFIDRLVDFIARKYIIRKYRLNEKRFDKALEKARAGDVRALQKQLGKHL